MDRPAEMQATEHGGQTSVGGRLAWAGVAVCCLAVLLVARWLQPDKRGFGTHEQIGMPPCGMVLVTGLPCPTCGMTTAFSLVMHGHPWLAARVQPAGAVLCLGTILLLGLAVYVSVSGRGPRVNWDRLGPTRVALAFALLLIGGWAFKMAHGLLTGTLPRR
jgi:hypothetical protein